VFKTQLFNPYILLLYYYILLYTIYVPLLPTPEPLPQHPRKARGSAQREGFEGPAGQREGREEAPGTASAYKTHFMYTIMRIKPTLTLVCMCIKPTPTLVWVHRASTACAWVELHKRAVCLYLSVFLS
jgi:hypothetical protein